MKRGGRRHRQIAIDREGGENIVPVVFARDRKIVRFCPVLAANHQLARQLVGEAALELHAIVVALVAAEAEQSTLIGLGVARRRANQYAVGQK